MKKKLLAAAVVLTAVLMLGGCEGLSAKNAKGPETEESCLYITKDGNLQWVSEHTRDQTFFRNLKSEGITVVSLLETMQGIEGWYIAGGCSLDVMKKRYETSIKK